MSASAQRAGQTATNAAITSASQLAATVTGGLMAVVVGIAVGNTPETDGFFAAYGVYAMVISFAQSTRTTIVARLLESDRRFGAFDRYLGAGLVVFAVASIVFGPLGGVVAGLLTGDLPAAAGETAQRSLLVLWPAVALQLFAALGAAMLGALENFVWAGGAFVAGSLISIAAFIALQPAMGIDGLPVALLVGSVLSAALIAVALVRAGWRPSTVTLTDVRPALRAAGTLTVSSVSFIIAQIGFLVMLAIGARLGVGTITIFTYAYMAMGLLNAVFVASIPMVLAAPLARSWDRDAASLVPHHTLIFRTGAMLAVPVVAVAALIGDDVGRLVLAAFTRGEVTLMIELFLLLSLNVLFGLAQTVPYAVLVAIGRYWAVAVMTAVVVAVQVVVALVAGSLESPHVLALAVPLGSAVSTVASALVVSRQYPRLAGPPLAVVLVRVAGLTALAFGVPALLANGLGLPAADLVASVAGVVLFVVAVLALLPPERDVARRLAALVPIRAVRSAAQA